jgi:hypothetical protein
MSVKQLILDTLSPLGVPVSFATYDSLEPTYIVFLEYNQAPLLNADDEEMYTKHFYQMDVFSDGNYTQLVKDVKNLMKSVGFGRMFESETYDPDLKKYRKIIRFSYVTNKEEL